MNDLVFVDCLFTCLGNKKINLFYVSTDDKQPGVADILSMEDVSKQVFTVANSASLPQILAVGLVFDLSCCTKEHIGNKVLGFSPRLDMNQLYEEEKAFHSLGLSSSHGDWMAWQEREDKNRSMCPGFWFSRIGILSLSTYSFIFEFQFPLLLLLMPKKLKLNGSMKTYKTF